MGTPDGSSLRDDDALKLLIEDMYNSTPPRRKIWPSWELDVVLETLNKLPYEPNLSASLRDVTLKTAFLLTIASGRRSSKIHTLVINDHMVFFQAWGNSVFQTIFKPGMKGVISRLHNFIT